MRVIKWRLFRLAGLFLLTLLAAGTVLSRASLAADPGVRAAGWLGEVWTDSAQGCSHTWVLSLPTGQVLPLAFPPGAAPAEGNAHARGQWVAAGGRLGPGPAGLTLYVASLAAARLPQAVRAPQVTPSPSLGKKRYVTILCRFADSTANTPRDPAYFNGLLGKAYPGLAHYYQEQSHGALDLSDYTVKGWYNLPHPHDYYFGADHITDFYDQQALQDCIAAADADVDFSQYDGINCVFNVFPFPFWGKGGRFTLTVDGVTKEFGVTWERPVRGDYASLQYAWAHEVGHSLGFLHSAGPGAKVVDSKWDVMSYGWAGDDPNYAYIGSGIIAYTQDLAGWVPGARRKLVRNGTNETIRLERLDLPTNSTDFLLAKIPVSPDGQQFYTVEARRQAGYDGNIPAEAVIIHSIDPNRPDGNGTLFTPAVVVDPDLNGDPNDAAAQWEPGELFQDAANGVQVQVIGSTGTGWTVRVQKDGTVLAPDALKARVVSAQEIDLSWLDHSTDETAYEVQRADSGKGFATVAMLPAGATQFADRGLISGQTYTYRVRATNAVGDSAWSNEASATTPLIPPAAPDNLSATVVTSHHVHVTWRDNSNNEQQFELQRQDGSGSFVTIAVLPDGTATYDDRTLSPGVSYTYQVRAGNAAGNSGWSNQATAIPAVRIPATPTILSVVSADGPRITVNWRDNSDNETSFQLERQEAGGPFSALTTLDAGVTTYVDSTVQPVTTYGYRLLAVNEDGASSYSNIGTATTPAEPPNAPSALVATALSSSQVSLAWTDNSSDETGFRIERRSATGAVVLVSISGAGVVSYTDSGLSPGTVYSYRVQAVGVAGNSSYSNTATVTTRQAGPPNAPAALQVVSVSDTTIRLTWTDTSSDETGFRVERKTGAGNFAVAGSTGANLTSYMDAGLTPGTVYTYQVKAYNGQGDSGYSNSLSARTSGPPVAPSDLTVGATSPIRSSCPGPITAPTKRASEWSAG